MSLPHTRGHQPAGPRGSSPTSTFTVRSLSPDDVPAVLQLLVETMRVSSGGDYSEAFFRWKHERNPFGVSPGLIALDGERVVGVRLFLRWTLQAGDLILRAVRPVDTATHPDYQGLGIFRRLTTELLKQMEETAPVDLVFNTPNLNSLPGYLRMGWSPVGTLPVHISPVRPVSFLRGAFQARNATAAGRVSRTDGALGIAARTSSLPRADVAFQDVRGLEYLLAAQAPNARLHTPLTVDYLRWRYADAPTLDYRCIQAFTGRALVGIGFGRVRTRAALTEFTLGDVITHPGDTRTAARIMRAARHSGADHVATHAAPGTTIRTVTLRSLYAKTPGRGITLVARQTDRSPISPLDLDCWGLSLGDLEVF
jgi:GNAT superfamily N-acetyltransferase